MLLVVVSFILLETSELLRIYTRSLLHSFRHDIRVCPVFMPRRRL